MATLQIVLSEDYNRTNVVDYILWIPTSNHMQIWLK